MLSFINRYIYFTFLMRRLILLLLFFYCNKAVHAQVYATRIFTTADGLINNRVSTINQDGAGYIWAGTDNGICRYDGRRFKYFPIPGINKYTFAPASRRYKQYVVIGHTYGIALCYGDSIININLKNNKPGHPVESLALNDSTFLYADAYDGFFKIEKDTVTRIEINNNPVLYVLVLYKDVYGNIWLGCSTKTIFYPGGDLTKPREFTALRDIYINTMKEDAAHNLYFVTERGIFRIMKENLKNPFEAPPQLLYPEHRNILSAVTFDQRGHAWVSNKFGVLRFTDDFKKHVLIAPENGIASGTAWDAFCDRENNLWFPTENGVTQLINKPIVSYRFPPNEYPSIKSGLVWNDSTFYYTNGTSLCKLVNDKVMPVKGFIDDPGYMEERLWKTPDNKMLINYNVIRRELNDGYYTRQVKDAGNTIIPDNEKRSIASYGYVDAKSIYNDPAGDMWYSSNDRRLHLYKKGKAYCYDIKTAAGKPARIFHITKDKTGFLWLACSKMLIRCSVAPAADSFYVQPVAYIDSAAGLNVQSYYRIFCDSRNRIWSGGGQGVLAEVVITGEGKIGSVSQYSPPQISGSLVTDFSESDNGNVWIGTNLGIDIISTDAAGNTSIKKDVYGADLCGKYIFFLRKQGKKMYAGTTGCMAVIDLGEEKITAPPPYVFITEIRIANSVCNEFLKSDKYELPPDSNAISFSFNATSFLSEGVQYKYMLEGADRAWSNLTTASNINYSRLGAGTYTFKVMAMNGDGVWSKAAAEKTFRIGRHFYNTLWFYLLCGAIFLLAVYLIYRYRINEIRKVHTIRTNISNDLHDDIGSTLSSITMMSNLVKQKIASDPVQSAAIASQIEESGRQMIYAMSDIVWSIKPGNDTPEQLINRLRDYMNIMLESTVEDYALIAEENVAAGKINMYLRRDIYLICKEIIHNTAKYAAATEMIMRISIEEGKLHINARDNGKGFDAETVKKGNGLQNIFMRVKANKGTVSCNAATGAGTAWDIRIPL
jgi:signal transduction histidine kinase/ligand-binding sensor domain-containing protein